MKHLRTLRGNLMTGRQGQGRAPAIDQQNPTRDREKPYASISHPTATGTALQIQRRRRLDDISQLTREPDQEPEATVLLPPPAPPPGLPFRFFSFRREVNEELRTTRLPSPPPTRPARLSIAGGPARGSKNLGLY